LNEIIGDDEQLVFEKLRIIDIILKSSKTVDKLTPELKLLRQKVIDDLFEDKDNLLVWCFKSNRIHVIFDEIKSLL
jgi:hypothetical protein